jgi:hypothetical protein
MVERGFWRHLPTGHLWAVEIENQKLLRCAGPLAAHDVTLALLPHVPFSTRYVSLLQVEWSAYVPYLLCSVCGNGFGPGAATATNGADGSVHLDCSLKLQPPNGDSVGAAVLVESLWQTSARLRHLSRAFRRRSRRLQERCRAARSTYVLPLVT